MSRDELRAHGNTIRKALATDDSSFGHPDSITDDAFWALDALLAALDDAEEAINEAGAIVRRLESRLERYDAALTGVARNALRGRAKTVRRCQSCGAPDSVVTAAGRCLAIKRDVGECLWSAVLVSRAAPTTATKWNGAKWLIGCPSGLHADVGRCNCHAKGAA